MGVEWFQNSQLEVDERLDKHLSDIDKRTIWEINKYLRNKNTSGTNIENEVTLKNYKSLKPKWKTLKKSINSILYTNFDKELSLDDVVSFKEDNMAYHSRANRALNDWEKFNNQSFSSLKIISQNIIKYNQINYDEKNLQKLTNYYDIFNNTINKQNDILNEEINRLDDTEKPIPNNIIRDFQSDRNVINQKMKKNIDKIIKNKISELGSENKNSLQKIEEITSLQIESGDFMDKTLFDNKIEEYIGEFKNNFKENLSNVDSNGNILLKYELQLKYIKSEYNTVKGINNSIIIKYLETKYIEIEAAKTEASSETNNKFLLEPTMDISNNPWFESTFQYYDQNDLLKIVLGSDPEKDQENIDRDINDCSLPQLDELAYLMWVSELEKSLRTGTFESNNNVSSVMKWLKYKKLNIWWDMQMVKFLFSTTSNASTKLAQLKHISDMLPDNTIYKELINYVKSSQYVSDFNSLVDVYAEDVYKNFDYNDPKADYHHMSQISVNPNKDLLVSASLDNKWNPVWLWLMFYSDLENWGGKKNKLSIDVRNFENMDNPSDYTWFYMKLSGLDNRESKDYWQEIITVNIWAEKWRLGVDKFWKVSVWDKIDIVKKWEEITSKIYYDVDSQELRIQNKLLKENNFVHLTLETSNKNENYDQVSLSLQSNGYPTISGNEPMPLNFSGWGLFEQGQYWLELEFESKLDEYILDIKSYLLKYPNKKVQVSGFTNSDPVKVDIAAEWKNITNNLELSEKRAEVVKKYLISKGIPENKIDSNWYWDTKLVDKKGNVVHDKLKEHKDNSRRVEIRMI